MVDQINNILKTLSLGKWFSSCPLRSPLHPRRWLTEQLAWGYLRKWSRREEWARRRKPLKLSPNPHPHFRESNSPFICCTYCFPQWSPLKCRFVSLKKKKKSMKLLIQTQQNTWLIMPSTNALSYWINTHCTQTSHLTIITAYDWAKQKLSE